MSVKIYKLISGEELIATTVETTTTSLVVEDAVTLVYHQLEGGKMSAGFAPFMPYSSGKIELELSAIAASAEVKAEMLQEYKRIFSSIITPPSGLVL
jgi:hypothetical protein